MLTGRKAQIAELGATKAQAAVQPSISPGAAGSRVRHIVRTREVTSRTTPAATPGLGRASG